MDIIHIGHSSFRIKGKKASLVTDPYDPDFVGMKLPKIEADIVTISHSHQDHSFIEGVAGSPLVINGPGEYEIKGVKINPPVFIGKNVKIKATCTIGPHVIIGDNVIIREKSIIKSSIVFENMEISKNSNIKNKIIF